MCLLPAHNKKLFSARFKAITVPVKVARPKNPMTHEGHVNCAMWKSILFDDVGKYALEGLLPPEHQDALFRSWDALSNVCQYELMKSEIDELELKLLEAQARMELVWPVRVMSTANHVTFSHTGAALKRFGGPKLVHMPPAEDFFGVMIKSLHGKHTDRSIKELLHKQSIHIMLNLYTASSGNIRTSAAPSGGGDSLHEQTPDNLGLKECALKGQVKKPSFRLLTADPSIMAALHDHCYQSISQYQRTFDIWQSQEGAPNGSYEDFRQWQPTAAVVAAYSTQLGFNAEPFIHGLQPHSVRRAMQASVNKRVMKASQETSGTKFMRAVVMHSYMWTDGNEYDDYGVPHSFYSLKPFGPSSEPILLARMKYFDELHGNSGPRDERHLQGSNLTLVKGLRLRTHPHDQFCRLAEINHDVVMTLNLPREDVESDDFQVQGSYVVLHWRSGNREAI